MRGEHFQCDGHTHKRKGSSPHARGARVDKLDVRVFVGIIPACAGSTFNYILTLQSNGDHPRMRGEHVISPTMDDTR